MELNRLKGLIKGLGGAKDKKLLRVEVRVFYDTNRISIRDYPDWSASFHDDEEQRGILEYVRRYLHNESSRVLRSIQMRGCNV